MTIDHHADLIKYVPNADKAKYDAIVKHLGIAMKGTDSQLVSCSSKEELATVREKWCKKKLALTQADADLDKAIHVICEKMKGDKNKSRVAFYYMLAQHFDKLAVLK
jgi:Protein of unknown function (DUF2853)